MASTPRPTLIRSVTRRYRDLALLALDPVFLASLLVAGGFILMFVVWPLVRVIAQGFFTPEAQFSLEQFRRYCDPAYSRHYRLIFSDTMQMGTLSAFLGTTLGFIFAYSYVNCNAPFKRLVHLVALIPTISPPFSIAIAAILLFGRNGDDRCRLAHQSLGGGLYTRLPSL